MAADRELAIYWLHIQQARESLLRAREISLRHPEVLQPGWQADQDRADRALGRLYGRVFKHTRGGTK